MSSNMVRPSKPVERMCIEPEHDKHPGAEREINEVHRSNSQGGKLADDHLVSGQESIGNVGGRHKERVRTDAAISARTKGRFGPEAVTSVGRPCQPLDEQSEGLGQHLITKPYAI